MHFLNKIAALSTVFALMIGGFSPYSASAQTVDGASLNTQLPDMQHLGAYRSALSAARLASMRQFPAKMKQVEAFAAVVKADMSKLIAELKANNEVVRFEASALESAYKAGGQQLVSAITAAGGPVAVLSKASSEIDLTIRELKQEQGESTATWRNLFGMPVAHAFWQELCGFGWFVISFGYADSLAYHGCYK